MFRSDSAKSSAVGTVRPSTKERRRRFQLDCEALERKALLASFVVTHDGFVDNPCETAGTLHSIIRQVNASPGPHTIEFSTTLGTSGMVLINGSGLPQINEQVLINGFSYLGQDLGNRNIALAYRAGFNPQDWFCNNPLLGSDGFMLWFNSGAAGSEIRTMSFIRYGFATVGPSLSGVYSNAPITVNQTSTFGTLRLAVSDSIAQQITPIQTGIQIANVNGAVIQGNSFIGNQGAGIVLTGTTRNTLISSNNIIRNVSGGINAPGSGAGNTFTINTIYLNGNRGIDLGNTTNQGILAPVLTGASSNNFNGSLNITGVANGLVAGQSYRLEFFTTQRANAFSAQEAQGQRYLRSVEFVAPSGGSYIINETFFGAGVPVDDLVTATITRLSAPGANAGSTSEFSDGMTVVRTPDSDLSIAIDAPRGSVTAGSSFVYTMYVSNYGFDPSVGILLRNDYTANIVPVSGTIIVDGRVIGEVTIPPNPGQSLLIPLLGTQEYATTIVEMRYTAIDAGPISFTGTVSSPSFDPVPANNTVTVQREVVVTPRATLTLAESIRSDNPDATVFSIGDILTYELTIASNGPDIANAVMSYTNIAEGLEFVGATALSGTTAYDPVTRRVTANLGNVINETKVLIKVRGVRDGVFLIGSQASTTSLSDTPVVPVVTAVPIMDIPGVLRFTQGQITVTEQDVPHIVEIPVQRIEGTLGNATVQVRAIDGTAIEGIDYELLTTEVVFPDGDRSPQFVQVRILTTAQWYQSKDFRVELYDATDATLGFPTTSRVTILDSQPAPVGTIVFKGATPNPVSESGGFITVEVERVDGTSKMLAVTLATANGTAVAGTNFGTAGSTAQFSRLITWNEGEMGSKFVNIPILQDGVFTTSALDFQIGITAANDDTTITGLSSETIYITNTTQTSNLTFNPLNYQVLEDAGTVTVTVTRTIVPLADGYVPPLSVDYATANGTALAGIDYVAASGTLSWAAGDTSPKSFSIGIIDKSTIELDRNFFVNLSNVVLAANGSITGGQAQVVIKDTDIDATGPKVGVVQFSGTAASVSQIFLTFSESLDVASATNPANYVVRNGGSGTVAVTGVQYLPGSNSVIVNLPANTLRANTFYTLTVNGTAPSGVRDIFGNLLDGAGTNGTNYVVSFARGTSVNYVDNMNNRVNIGLRNGGFFDITRYPNGQAQWLAVYNVTRSSVLSGSVRRIDGSSTGYTRIDTLSGIGNPWFIRVTMTTPPFYVQNVVANNPPLPGGAVPVAARMAAKKLTPPRIAPARVLRVR